MAKVVNKLDHKRLKTYPTGMHSDGDNLYLSVTTAGSRSWVFRYRPYGRSSSRDMGLGSITKIGLAEARSAAQKASQLLLAGIDPIDARRVAKGIKRDNDEKTRMTFKRCASTFIAMNKTRWGKKHVKKWEQHFNNHVYPKFGNEHVDKVDIKHIKRTLDPIWNTKPALAKVLRQRIARVLDWAAVSKYRTGDNPARWDGYLEHHYGTTPALSENQPSMPYEQVPQFMRDLELRGDVISYAFRFLILTASRTQEALLATWSEIDLDNAVWTIPKNRMGKGKREHKVPLSAPALQILKAMQELKVSEYVFPGTKPNQPLSEGVFRGALNQMKRADATPHGMRATFRTWADEETDYPNEVKEMALSHAIRSGTEAAYRRGTLFEKRKHLMADWSSYCMPV